MSNRSTVLDKYKVRAKATTLGIYKEHQFDTAYCNRYNKCGEHRAPKHAWNGKRLALKGAREIAELLEVSTYHELEPDKEMSAWFEYLDKVQVKNNFSKLLITSPTSDIKGMFDLNEFIIGESIKKVDVNSRFYFEFEGEASESVIIMLSSPIETWQLAPIRMNTCNFNNTFYQKKLRYPQSKSIPFLKGSIGWRRFVVIKGQNIPIVTRDASSLKIDLMELDRLAIILKDMNVMIDIHEFVIEASSHDIKANI